VEREQRLSASEEKFASLFLVSPDPICVTRQDTGQFIEINPAFHPRPSAGAPNR
jgi:diguanylate cyclase/phosphodiesterase with PAS/PAC sensor(s)